uniref:Nectin cell adhesion molecule 4a n=1 Tax=Amphilophus citrinellus TaxID=61819 RepID=A0A3Q0SZE7_AMPCI
MDSWVYSSLLVRVIPGDFVEPPPNHSLISMAEDRTILPCHYKPSNGTVVVQVTWLQEKPDGTKEQIITAHHINGQTAFGSWSQRVHFKSNQPTVDSSLVIMGTEVSDEGKYICRVSAFPSGNFDTHMSLIVWTHPISSVEPVTVVEGQDYRQVASCRSVARPPPRLTWDTDLNGQSVNRSSESGAISSHFSLHPLRNMNGKKLDCLVWHPTYSEPRRLKNQLVVLFPPHAEVSGYSGNWHVGLENAALSCVSGGNPKPHVFTWIRKDGELPKGVIQHANGTLAFERPLNLSDAGTYQCVATNEVGVGKAEEQKNLENTMMFIVGGVAIALLILLLTIVVAVTCHHKRKNKRLKRELTEKKYEIIRHENIPLRVEGTLRSSLSSLGQAQCRDSRSTLSGGRGGVGAYDSLGRPALYNNSRRGRERPVDREEESRLRVERYVKNNSLSLPETHFHPPLTPSSFQRMQSHNFMRPVNGSAIVPSDVGSRQGSVTKNHQHPPMSSTCPPIRDDDDEVDEGLGGPASQERPFDQDSETNSSQVSEATSMHCQHSNGMLKHKRLPSPTLVSPHASIIHKAQIV